MSPRLEHSFNALSFDSTAETELDGSQDSSNGSPESTVSVSQAGMELAQREIPATGLSNLERHQEIYLSLIESQCRMQATNILNAQRSADTMLGEDDPDVDNLAEHLFAEMVKQLHKAGIISNELAGKDLRELRRVSRKLKGSFDSFLNELATKRPQPSRHVIEDSMSSNFNNFLGQHQSTLFEANNRTRDIIQIPHNFLPSHPFNNFGLPSSLQRYQAPVTMTTYQKEYKQLGLLGKGGFGKVYKVYCNLDRKNYAIKQIAIPAERYRSLTERHGEEAFISELLALSSLQHKNIVRYFHSWVEPRPLGSSNWKDDSSSESESGDETVDDIESKAGDVTWDQDIQLRRMMKQSRRESLMSFKDDDIIFQNSSSAAQKKKSSNKSSNKASAEVSSKTKAVVLRGRFFEGGSGDSDDASSDSVDKVLYIKMALHSMTLDDLLWADDRPSSDNSSALRHCYHAVPSARLLLAILDGVDYIHSQGIVHRDLKPSNILLSVLEGKTCFVEGAVNISDCPTCGGERNLWVIPHIGDFGLVAEMREASPNLSKPTTSLQVYQPSTLAILSSQASRQAGTRFYYPPGKSDKTICPRLDVYSLGVIAFELTNSFGTRSERLVVLENLNRGIYPIGFDEHKMANGVKGMLYHERLKRWDCATLRRWLEDIIR